MESCNKIIKLLVIFSVGFITLLLVSNPVMTFFSKGISYEVADQFRKLF